MPLYSVQEISIDISRDAVLIDTNILVRAFCAGEQKDDKEYAYFFLEENDHQLLIPIAVIIEAWGLIVGSKKDWTGGYNLLAWLNTPGKAFIIIPQKEKFEQEHILVNGLSGLDYVDAIIYYLAHDISIKCNLNPVIPVATYDTKDFYKLKTYKPDLKARLYEDLP